MNKIQKWLGIATLGVIFAIAVILVLVGGNSQSVLKTTFGGTSNYDSITLDGTNSTSTTVTSYTMVASDIIGFSTVLFTPNTGATTLTFPATTTLNSADFIPRAGQMTEQCWVNSTSTTAATIIFVAGTGIDLETSSSTPSDLTLSGNNTACFHYIRKKNSDITITMTEYNDGD